MAGAKDRIGSQGSALQSTGAGTSERARRDRGRQTAGGNGVRTCNFGQKRSTRLETEMHSRKRPREGAVSCSLEAASGARSLTECVRSTKLESIQAAASSQAQVRTESLRQADRYATYIESKSSSGLFSAIEAKLRTAESLLKRYDAELAGAGRRLSPQSCLRLCIDCCQGRLIKEQSAAIATLTVKLNELQVSGNASARQQSERCFRLQRRNLI